MGLLWTFVTHLHSLAGPVMMLLYPVYESIMVIEGASKVDDEQWLAYWIVYSFLTIIEMMLRPILQWIPIWYDVKLVLVSWLVLPQFRGASFLYETFVREKLMEEYGLLARFHPSHGAKSEEKFVHSDALKKKGMLKKKKGRGE